jgi:hypothetical protein
MKIPATILFLEFECLVNDYPATCGKSENREDHSRDVPRSTVAYSSELLAKIIAPYGDDIGIVITDWIAIHAPLDEFCRRLPACVANRVIDSVYLEELTDSSWSDYHSALATRYACIQLWLSRCRIDFTQNWLALDLGRQLDDWPKDKMEHLVCGFLSYPNVQHQLEQRLSNRKSL